jgi:pyruvate/2-oxoglutarate dehydrogenase complex dihydrolipoamide dehydrogenase (E3) component
MAPSDGVIAADIAVIGAGSGGLSVAAVTARLGLSTVLIERARMGGDCLNTGCVPSKALLAAAHAAEATRRLGRLGLSAGPVDIDWSAVQAHVQAVIDGIAPHDSVARFEGLGARVLLAEARFIAPDTLRAGAATIRARRIVIAAGSRPAIPAIPGLDGVPYVTHETLFTLSPRPDHLVILGGGAIGLEMAQAHAALGCAVTIVERARLGGREDPELVDVLRRALTQAGVRVLEGASVVAAEPGPALRLADGRRVAGSHLLIAAGRVPDLAALDLPAGRVAASARGIATDAGLRSTTNRRVFAVGDIADPAGIGPRHLTHAASHHAGIVIRRAVFRLPARVRAVMPRAIFTDPELAQVGLTEAEARATGRAVQVLRWPLADNDRARTERATEGMAKLIVGRGGRILGAGIVAPQAGEMIGAWTLAIDRGIRLATMADLIVPYPTRAEIGKRAAGSGLQSRLFAPATRRLARVLALLP